MSDVGMYATGAAVLAYFALVGWCAYDAWRWRHYCVCGLLKDECTPIAELRRRHEEAVRDG